MSYKLKIMNAELMDKLSADAKASPRLRAHYNLHESLDEDVHRLAIATEPGTYVKPHRHYEVPKWELFMVLRGKVAVLFFEENGTVVERVELDATGACRAVELPAEAWHSFVALEPDSVVMEVKKGPYLPPKGAADSAQWAPNEGEAGAKELEKWYVTAGKGDLPPVIKGE